MPLKEFKGRTEERRRLEFDVGSVRSDEATSDDIEGTVTKGTLEPAEVAVSVGCATISSLPTLLTTTSSSPDADSLSSSKDRSAAMAYQARPCPVHGQEADVQSPNLGSKIFFLRKHTALAS